MVYSTEGVVLKNSSYAEADLIVTYFTKDYGLINLFAKSPLKIKSRFGSSLEPLTHSRISFIGREESLQRIIQSDIINSFHKVRENYKLFLKVGETLRFLIHIMPKKEPNIEIFHLLLNTIKYLEEKTKPENYLLFLKIRTLNILGYLPEFKSCGVCSKNLKDEFYYFDGFIICKTCYDVHQNSSSALTFPISQGVIKLLNEISKWKMNLLERVKISNKLLNEVDKLLETHIFKILGYNKAIDSIPSK
ncbi:MAG: DNA repair protein RecO [Thermodesulfovibrio sp.]|nr:DNA repair protein RecO [Thermodesulfovibrio sp.]